MPEVSFFVVAFPEPHAIGEPIKAAGMLGTIAEEMTRAEFMEAIALADVKGMGSTRSTALDDRTQLSLLVPTPTVPPEMKYFYRCKLDRRQFVEDVGELRRFG